MLNTWLEKTMASDALPNLAKEYLIISTLVEEIRSSNQMEGIYSTRKKLKEKLKIQLMCTIIWYKDYVNTLILNTCH